MRGFWKWFGYAFSTYCTHKSNLRRNVLLKCLFEWRASGQRLVNYKILHAQCVGVVCFWSFRTSFHEEIIKIDLADIHWSVYYYQRMEMLQVLTTIIVIFYANLQTYIPKIVRFWLLYYIMFISHCNWHACTCIVDQFCELKTCTVVCTFMRVICLKTLHVSFVMRDALVIAGQLLMCIQLYDA